MRASGKGDPKYLSPLGKQGAVGLSGRGSSVDRLGLPYGLYSHLGGLGSGIQPLGIGGVRSNRKGCPVELRRLAGCCLW